MSVTFKFILAGECRRLRINRPDAESIESVSEAVEHVYGIKDFILTYIDDEQDIVTVKQNGDLSEATRYFNEMGRTSLRFDVNCKQRRDKDKNVLQRNADLCQKLNAALDKVAELELANAQLTQNINELGQKEVCLMSEIFELGDKENRLISEKEELVEELQSLQEYSADVSDKNDGLNSSLLSTAESVKSMKQVLDRMGESLANKLPEASKPETSKPEMGKLPVPSMSDDAALARRLEQEMKDAALARALQEMNSSDNAFSSAQHSIPQLEFSTSVWPQSEKTAKNGSTSPLHDIESKNQEAEHVILGTPSEKSAAAPITVADVRATVGGNPTLDFGQRLQVFYQGRWYESRFIKMNEADGQYIVQCDADEEGNYTSSAAEFIRLACNQTAVAGTWKCNVCCVPNKATATHCKGCSTANPDSKGGASEAEVGTPGDFQFGSSGADDGSSEFVCGVVTPSTQSESAAAVMDSVVLKNAEEAKESTPETGSIWNQIRNHRAAAGTWWKCNVCCVQNRATANRCKCCSTANPDSKGGASEAEVGTSGDFQRGSSGADDGCSELLFGVVTPSTQE